MNQIGNNYQLAPIDVLKVQWCVMVVNVRVVDTIDQ